MPSDEQACIVRSHDPLSRLLDEPGLGRERRDARCGLQIHAL